MAAACGKHLICRAHRKFAERVAARVADFKLVMRVALDAAVQISAFVKLKLTNCANCARAGNRAGHLLEDWDGRPSWAPVSAGRPREPPLRPGHCSALIFI